ncbi:Fc.00g084220.m01.CDS01 [Cosmosporella sp. VM-42]
MACHPFHPPFNGRTSVATPAPSNTSSKRRSSRSKPKASFRQRFWTTSSANHFSDDDLPAPKPVTRGAYVPRHAASDFSKTATSQHRMSVVGSVAGSRASLMGPRVNVVGYRRSVLIQIDDDEAATLCSFNEEKMNESKRYSRAISPGISSGSQTPSPSHDFAAFLAQAASTDHLHHASAWAEDVRSSPTPNLHRRSAYIVVTPVKHKRRPFLQRVAEYIRPGTAGRN